MGIGFAWRQVLIFRTFYELIFEIVKIFFLFQFSIQSGYNCAQGTLLLTWINLSSSMDKRLHPL